MITIDNKQVEAFIDLGNGFKFIVEDAEINDFGHLILKVHPKSIKWIELEHDLEKILTNQII